MYFTGTLYWITLVMAVYGGLPMWVAAILNGALIAYLALFPALFAVVMRRALAAFGARALAAAPLVWVATELGRTYILTGFPWVLLGYSQVEVLPIAQLASLVGVYGVSALVAAVSAATANVVVAKPGDRLRPAAAVAGLAPDRRRVGQPSRRAGGVDASRRADSRRARAGQRRSGAEVGSGAGVVHLHRPIWT